MTTAEEMPCNVTLHHDAIVHTHAHQHGAITTPAQGQTISPTARPNHPHAPSHAAYDSQADRPGEHPEDHHAAKAPSHDHNKPTGSG